MSVCDVLAAAGRGRQPFFGLQAYLMLALVRGIIAEAC